MANNPYVNKVQYGNATLIDLTSDTVTADKLVQGYTAHDKTGAVITGTAADPNAHTVRCILSDTSITRTIQIGSGSRTNMTNGAEYTFNTGDTIITRVVDGGAIYYNGEKVKTSSSTVSYTFTAPSKDLEISCESDMMYIVENSGDGSHTVNLGAMPDDLNKAYVKDSEGIKHSLSNTSFTVQEGEQLYVYVYGSSSVKSYIYYNNVIVASNTYTVVYEFNMPKYDIDVSVSGDDASGITMRISTPMLAINKNGYHNVENYGFVDVQAAPTYTATFITTSGDKDVNYVSYTDASGLATKYYSVGSTFTFSAGDTATFVGTHGDACKRYLNGELISTDTNYVYTLPACNIEIQLQNYNSPSSQYAIQRITTSDGIDALTITQNGTYTASGDAKGYSPITVNVSGGATLITKNITTNGTYNASSDNADGYSSVTVNVSGGSPNLQNKTVSPTTSQQTVHADSGYDGLDTVTVNAMPTGTAGTPIAAKGAVSNHSVSVTPSVNNTTGYISGGTKTGTAVMVSASELVSGSETKTDNGTYDVTNLASLVVNIPFVTYYTGSSDPASTLGNDGDIYLKVVS